MQETFVIEAELRTEQGTGASRRLRHAGIVPGIVYGGAEAPQMISVSHNELWKHLKHEAFYSHILTLSVGGAEQKVVLKDLHRHPVREEIMHLDLQRVMADVAIRMHVPLHFKGDDVAPGVKTGGGMLEHLLNDIEIECLPSKLPEFIEVDCSTLNTGDSVHLSNLKLPEGVVSVELKHGNDSAVVSLHPPRGGADEEEAAEGDETP